MTTRARRAGRFPTLRPLLRGSAVLACALLAGGSLGCSSPIVKGGSEMQVEADVFSGRPNPRWALDPAQSRELAQRLAELPAGPSAPTPEGLGYRGLVVTGLEGGCGEVRVLGGRVQGECGGEPRAWTDADRSLERWLLATGKGDMEPATAELLRREVEG